MRIYKVTITETLEKIVEVEARDKIEAEQIVSDAWHDSEYVLYTDDFTGVKFTAEPIVKNREYNAR